MSSKDTEEGTLYADRFESCLAKTRSAIKRLLCVLLRYSLLKIKAFEEWLQKVELCLFPKGLKIAFDIS